MWAGAGLVLLSAAGYAMLPILVIFVYDETSLNPTDLVLWRFILASGFMWLFVNARRETPEIRALSSRQIVKIGLLGALFGGAVFFAFFALDRIPASTYTVLLYTYPASVALISSFLGEKMGALQWGAIALTFIGCLLTVGGRIEGGDLLGMLFAIGNGTSYAVYLVIAQRNETNVSPFAFGAVSMTGTLIAVVPFAILDGVIVPENLNGWLAIVGLVLIATILPILTMLEGVRRIGAANASIISTVEPAMTVILAAILLHEKLTLPQLIGGGLILASVILLQIPTLRAAQAA